MTMVELLVALALISIVACGLIAVYWSGSSALERENTRIDAQYDARLAIDKISRDIWEGNFYEVQDVAEENDNTQKGHKLYIERKEGQKVHTITYRVNNNANQRDYYRKLQRVYNNGRNIDTKTITFNRADICFTDIKAGDLVQIEIIIKDDKDNQVYKLITCCKSRME